MKTKGRKLYYLAKSYQATQLIFMGNSDELVSEMDKHALFSPSLVSHSVPSLLLSL